MDSDQMKKGPNENQYLQRFGWPLLHTVYKVMSQQIFDQHQRLKIENKATLYKKSRYPAPVTYVRMYESGATRRGCKNCSIISHGRYYTTKMWVYCLENYIVKAD